MLLPWGPPEAGGCPFLPVDKLIKQQALINTFKSVFSGATTLPDFHVPVHAGAVPISFLVPSEASKSYKETDIT